MELPDCVTPLQLWQSTLTHHIIAMRKSLVLDFDHQHHHHHHLETIDPYVDEVIIGSISCNGQPGNTEIGSSALIIHHLHNGSSFAEDETMSPDWHLIGTVWDQDLQPQCQASMWLGVGFNSTSYSAQSQFQ